MESTYYRNCRWDVLDFVPAGVGRVLDVGCGEGATGAELLRAGRATSVDGIELVPDVADRARRHYRRVVVGDLGHVDRSALASDYDTMLCNDVLEHVPDPWSTLRDLADDHVRLGGSVVVSVPNVQCVEVLAPLLRGRFEYADDGILDRTHLRFFTRTSARDLVRSAGLEIVAEGSVRIGRSRGWPARWLGRALGPYGVRQLLLLTRRAG